MLGLKGRLLSGLIIGVLIFNVIIINLNVGSQGGHLKNEASIPNNILSNPRADKYNWSQIEIISEPVPGLNLNNGWSSEPGILVEDDKIYVVWNDETDYNGSGTDSDIFYRYFNGNNWSDIQVISEPVKGKNINTEKSTKPDIAVDNGKVYIVWQDLNNTNGAGVDWDIFYRCNLTGKGWEDIEVISEPTQDTNVNIRDSISPEIVVENGNIYVIWVDDTNLIGAGYDQDLFFRCNTDGISWGPIQVLSEPVVGNNYNTGNHHPQNVRIDIEVENGNIYVVWDDVNDTYNAGTDLDIYFRCKMSDNSWGDIQVISEPVIGKNTNTYWDWQPLIAIDNGMIYISWAVESGNINGSGTDREVVIRSNLTGSNWEDIQVISEPISGQNSNTGISIPHGLEAENGNVFSVWFDTNNTKGAGNDFDIFLRCYIIGKGWGSIKVVSEPVFGKNNMVYESQRPDIAVNHGKCHIVWDCRWDCNGSDKDIYYRAIQAPVPPLFLPIPKVNPVSGNTSTEFNFTVRCYHLNNEQQTSLKFYLDNEEYSILEMDQSDTNYSDGKDYYCTLNKLDIGRHNFYFWASDGKNVAKTIPIKMPNVCNTKPEIITSDNLTAIEDTYYKVNYEFVDIDRDNVGQVCYWDFNSNASWLKFVPEPPSLYGTPTNDDVGKYWVYVEVSDDIDTDSTYFTLEVLDVNDEPKIITKNVRTAYEDQYYYIDYNASDIDSPLKKQLWLLDTNATSWLNINSTSGELNGIPTNNDVGIYSVNVSVNDAEGGFDFTTFTLEVINVNDPPEIITEVVNYTYTGKSYEVDYNATDIDSPVINQIWLVTTDASWLTIDPVTGLLSGIPPHSDSGLFNVNVSVTDGDGGIDWQVFVLNVKKSNVAPTIITKNMEYAIVNEFYKVDYEAVDDSTPEDLLYWMLDTNATWLMLDSNSGILSGVPTFLDGRRSYWVNISVYDRYDGWDFKNFTITVLPEQKKLNNVPKLLDYKIEPKEGDTETVFTFSVLYLDLDSQPAMTIQVVIDDKKYEMELQAGELSYNGKYEYKTKLTEGEHTYYFTASDGIDSVRSEDFKTTYVEMDLEKESKDDDAGLLIIAIFIVVIIIVILILSYLMLQRKKKVKEKEVQEISLSPQPLVYPPNVYPTVITPRMPETSTPATLDRPYAQDNIYPSPPMEITTYETMQVYPTPELPIEPYITPEESYEQVSQTVFEQNVDQDQFVQEQTEYLEE